ncbi:MAG: ABC transporter ATP-binding protein [Dethiobacter sp.]|jgi:zinc transport system ATP-binding protein|nr:MAG: ABC transporter ATP-binding protein [Dethiobacter sp.]
MTGPAVIETRDLNVYLEEHHILENINISIASGEMAGIIGPNGAGKTTLMRVLLGLVRATAGQVKIFGRTPEMLGGMRDEIGYIPQRPVFHRHFPVSTLDVVLMGMVTPTSLGRPFSRLQREKARDSLEMVGLWDLEAKPFTELSGGQQQRAFLARALCREPRLLLLDEPNAGLDLPAQSRFFTLLGELQQSHNLTVVMVSHDLTLIARYAHKLICINRTMHVHGSPAEVLNSPHLEKAYRCEFDVLFGSRERG